MITLTPSDGTFETHEHVAIDLPGEPMTEGEVVAQSPNGRVTVSIYDGTVEREVAPEQVHRTNAGIEAI